MTTLTKFVDGVEVPCTEQDIAEMEEKARNWAAFKAEEAKTQYQRDRAAEYPPMADYLDGVAKGDQAQIDAYIAACLAVKAKYPKPA
jgi:hypothetical protein